MLKKNGTTFLIVSIILTFVPLVYLPQSIFSFILFSFLILIIFGLGVAMLYAPRPFKNSLLPIILFNLIFTVINSIIGLLTQEKVNQLAKKAVNSNFQFTEQASNSFTPFLNLFFSFIWALAISLILLLVVKQIRKLKDRRLD